MNAYVRNIELKINYSKMFCDQICNELTFHEKFPWGALKKPLIK